MIMIIIVVERSADAAGAPFGLSSANAERLASEMSAEPFLQSWEGLGSFSSCSGTDLPGN